MRPALKTTECVIICHHLVRYDVRNKNNVFCALFSNNESAMMKFKGTFTVFKSHQQLFNLFNLTNLFSYWFIFTPLFNLFYESLISQRSEAFIFLNKVFIKTIICFFVFVFMESDSTPVFTSPPYFLKEWQYLPPNTKKMYLLAQLHL